MVHGVTYCDYNAGAPLRAQARAAMLEVLDGGANASSIHAPGRRVRAFIEDARERLAAAIAAKAENVVFTSGATEALHLALGGAGAGSLVVSAIEHDAVYGQAERAGLACFVAPVNPQGLIDLDVLGRLVGAAPRPALIVVQLANNETGVIQPIARVAALAREHGALLLVDAAQGLGRIPVSLNDLDASYLVLSSHKIGGPQGAGALVLAPGAPFAPTHVGGGQERGRRPGTENAGAIAGFGAAVEVATCDLDGESQRLARLRDRFEAMLPNAAVIFSADAPRAPNTSNFVIPGLVAETAVIAMDIEGVAVSSGAACSSGKVRASRVLAAMGVAPSLAKSALRVSFGWASQEADVDRALSALAKISARARSFEGVLR